MGDFHNGFGTELRFTDAEGREHSQRIINFGPAASPKEQPPEPSEDGFDAIWGHALVAGFNPAVVDREYRWRWSDFFADRGRDDIAEAIRVMAAYEMRPCLINQITWYWSGFITNIEGESPVQSKDAGCSFGHDDTLLPEWWLDTLGRETGGEYSEDFPTLEAAYRELARAYCGALADGAVPDVVRARASVFGEVA